MMTVNREVILKDGYEKASRIGIEPFLSDRELTNMYKEKMLAYGKDCGYTFTEEEVTAYIAEQFANIDRLQTKNDSPVHLRFQ